MSSPPLLSCCARGQRKPFGQEGRVLVFGNQAPCPAMKGLREVGEGGREEGHRQPLPGLARRVTQDVAVTRPIWAV